MNASDAFFFKGYGHDVCQDFCLAEDDLIILSDGCSSSPNTDFGARLITKMAANILKSAGYAFRFSVGKGGATNYIAKEFEDEMVAKIKELSGILQLAEGAFDATLLFSTRHTQYCYGDGVIAYIYGDSIIVYNICYPSGAPLYLNYSTNTERKEAFINEFSVRRDVLISVLDRKTGDLKQETEVSDTNAGPYVLNHMPADAIILMSDGVNTFDAMMFDETSRFKASVEPNIILQKLLSFKSFHGQFVKRRTKSFIKECKDLCWENFDDVSVAAMAL